jgi:MFS family permease
VLDGIAAGIFGALFFIVIADPTRGTGRYNLAQGAASASWGLGAALSNSIAGFIVDKAGFSAAFVFLAGCALAALLLLWIAMPETGAPKRRAWRSETTRRRRCPPAEIWHGSSAWPPRLRRSPFSR